MTEDELDQLEVVLLAAARRLRRLRASAAEADRTRIMVLRRIGELLGAGQRGGDHGNQYTGGISENSEMPLTRADMDRRYYARLLAAHAKVVDDELARPTPPALSRLIKHCRRLKGRARWWPCPTRRSRSSMSTHRAQTPPACTAPAAPSRSTPVLTSHSPAHRTRTTP